MKYKIGIDFTYIKDNNVSGIKKYGEEIVESLLKYSNNYEIILFVYDYLKEEYKKKFPNCKIIALKAIFRKIRFLRRIYIYKISRIPKLLIINRAKCDLVIHPFVDKLTPIANKNKKKIIGILDIIPLDIIENKESIKAKRIKKEYIKIMNRSKHITTLSNYSKNRLRDINPKYLGKISVIPSTIIKPKDIKKDINEIMLKSNMHYIFSINSFYKHKNQITLLKAFNKIKDEIPHNIVLVGRPELDSGMSGYPEIMEYIEQNDLKNRVKVMSFISDEDRNCLFYNTDLFVTTSTQEGFGRTPVEAAMCSVPVISSQDTSLKEATLGLVNYYENSKDENELANKILEVLNNTPSKEKLDSIAKRLEKEYNEENIAKKYMNLIDEILKEK